MEIHYLGYYIKWIPQEAYYYSVENTGLRQGHSDQKEHIVNIIVLMIRLTIFIITQDL